MKESLLFTGGTGFLGQNCQPILKQQYEVTTCGISPIDDIKAIWPMKYLIYLYDTTLFFMLVGKLM